MNQRFKKIKKLFSYYRPYKKIFVWDLILSVFSALIAIFIAIACNYMLSKAVYLEKSKTIETISFFGVIIILLFAIFYLCKRFTEYKGKIFAAKIESDIKIELFKFFQNQDFSFYDEQKIGKLMSNITNDAYNLASIIKRVPEVILDALIRFVGVFIFLFLNYKVFGTVLLISYIFIFIFMWNIMPKVQKINKSSREIFSDIISDLEENLSGIKIIKSFTNEQISAEKFIKNNKIYLETVDKMYKTQSIFDIGLLTFIIGIIPMITIVGAFFITNESMTINDLVATIFYIHVLESPLWNIVNLNEFLREGIVGFNRIYDILNIQPKIIDSLNALNLEHIKGEIEFKNVSFKYDKENKSIFNNLNLKINFGEYVALVGSSGVGKTTFCNLVPRFYDVCKGEILIDGININNIKLKDLRQNIGFVHQDTFLFSGTIMENIRFGKIESTDEEIMEAAKKAYAHDFIMNFPKGYNTQIGHRGLKLSGGQKQRLAIAQVFLKNPPILIFDEATSSLDNESEKYIQKSMEKLAENRTTIVIAHRLSTIKNAKRILVLEGGEIAEEGTHEELLNINGVYAEFYNLL